jgi:hypothetical protein
VYPVAPAAHVTFASTPQAAGVVAAVQQYPTAPLLSRTPAPHVSDDGGVRPFGHV